MRKLLARCNKLKTIRRVEESNAFPSGPGIERLGLMALHNTEFAWLPIESASVRVVQRFKFLLANDTMGCFNSSCCRTTTSRCMAETRCMTWIPPVLYRATSVIEVIAPHCTVRVSPQGRAMHAYALGCSLLSGFVTQSRRGQSRAVPRTGESGLPHLALLF